MIKKIYNACGFHKTENYDEMVETLKECEAQELLDYIKENTEDGEFTRSVFVYNCTDDKVESLTDDPFCDAVENQPDFTWHFDDCVVIIY